MTDKSVINTFRRTENKYSLSIEQKEQFVMLAGDHIIEDFYFQYTVHNIYMDTADNAMIIHCLEKPEYKEKIRMRTYGAPEEHKPVFLEIKKKYHGITAKRRVALSLAEADEFIISGVLKGTGQIVSELNAAISLYHPVPKVFAAYDRLSYAGTIDSDLRITFDTNLRYRTECLNLNLSRHDRNMFSDEIVLMEIKAADRCPLWLTEVMRELKIRPSSFSKYGTIYQKDLKDKLSTHRHYRQEPSPAYAYSTERSVLHV
ncbi:MAG: polyphosphate polymerase domain-containing protein [Erysipelotrichia bacterium]|nr:polyphosphate polymerase domain-containing protein [Erysipelotrichia bacterium]